MDTDVLSAGFRPPTGSISVPASWWTPSLAVWSTTPRRRRWIGSHRTRCAL